MCSSNGFFFFVLFSTPCFALSVSSGTQIEASASQSLVRRQESDLARVFGESIKLHRVDHTRPGAHIISKFRLNTSVGQKHLKIPKQLILTGPFASMREVFQHRGDLRLMGVTQELHVRYFNNTECHAYLEEYMPLLVKFYNKQRHGAYKGDICRTAILAREGGFYVDLDMQLVAPLLDLVDDETTFMTAKSGTEGCLNAIIAASPGNLVMLNTLAEMEKWFQYEHDENELLGPVTMQRGLENTLAAECPEKNWSTVRGQFKCGANNAVRLFQEQHLPNCEQWGSTLCPSMRARSGFEGQKYALFDLPHNHGVQITHPSAEDIALNEQVFIGWPRFEGCDGWGCGLTDHPDVPYGEVSHHYYNGKKSKKSVTVDWVKNHMHIAN